jgi:putative endonuclease
MVRNTKNIGNIGEKLTEEYLIKESYVILERNYRSKYGEIDIIALKNDKIFFFEVKTRKSLNYGLPVEAYTRTKQDRIIKTALIYINNMKIKKSFQFNLVSIVLNDTNNIKEFKIYENAIDLFY